MEPRETLKDSSGKSGGGSALSVVELVRFVEKIEAGGGTQKALMETPLSVCNLGFERGLESSARPDA